MGIGFCFLLFLAEKIHAGFLSWKDAGSREEASFPANEPDFRSDYASFATTLVAASLAAPQSIAAATTSDVGSAPTADGAPVTVSVSRDLAEKYMGKSLSWNSQEEEEDIYDKTKIR